jgi:hypothetical protein
VRRALQDDRIPVEETHPLTNWLADCKLTERARHQITDTVALVACGSDCTFDVSDFAPQGAPAAAAEDTSLTAAPFAYGEERGSTQWGQQSNASTG